MGNLGSMGDPRFMGTEQRRRMGAESSHLGMVDDPQNQNDEEALETLEPKYRKAVSNEPPEMTAVLGPPVRRGRRLG